MQSASLIVLLALAQYLALSFQVGAARGKYGVSAPAVSGHPVWERIFRAQQNTLEQIVVFVPATYAFAWHVSPTWVWLPGAAFILGRMHYAWAYARDPKTRGFGMALTFFSNFALVGITLVVLLLEIY